MKRGYKSPFLLREVVSVVRKKKVKKIAAQKTRVMRRQAKSVSNLSFAQARKEILGAQEVVVEQAKFSHPEIVRLRRIMPQDLPRQYGRDKIVLQVRDPRWIYSFWEVAPKVWERLKDELKDEFYKAKKVLRVYDVTRIVFNGRNAHSFFDLEVNYEADNWYINTNGPDRSWCVDLGLRLPDGRFITILRSNVVHTPAEGPSWITDEEWMIPDEMFGRLYGMGFGFGGGSPTGKNWQDMQKALFSGILASPGITSLASPVKRAVKGRKFWLDINCELIVYGATEPDAKVTVQERQIKLRPDGTFTLRFFLPDGKQAVPVKAVSSDKAEKRAITPVVTRSTKIG